MNFFTQKYNEYQKEFVRALSEHCAKMDFRPAVLTESMRYSLLLGGKRVRPVLFLSTLDAFKQDYRAELTLAVAIESVHTYSLIHDDLPAIDNDDFRRGQASNHKAFGEANAILAGDALLSYAFDLLLSVCGRGEKHLAAARELSSAAGAGGMISGQSADLMYTGKTGGREELEYIYRNKTGKLIAAPVVMGTILAEKEVAPMRAFGDSLGTLFQLTDDILDVKGEEQAMGKTLGKDEEEDKLTCVKVFGMEQSERLADEYAEKCRSCLNEAKGADTAFLTELIDMVRNRNH